MQKLIELLETELQEFKKENTGDLAFNRDEILDITSSLTDCDGCDSNSVWGYVRGLEQAINLIKSHIILQEALQVRKTTCDFCDNVAEHTAVIRTYYFSDSIVNENKRLCDEHFSHRKELSYKG